MGLPLEWLHFDRMFCPIGTTGNGRAEETNAGLLFLIFACLFCRGSDSTEEEIDKPAGCFGEKQMWIKADYLKYGSNLLLFSALVFATISEATAQNKPLEGNQPLNRKALKLTSGEEVVRNSPHPLEPALHLARETAERIDRELLDYTCDLVMRERIKGQLKNHEIAHLKVRREQRDGDQTVEPFSVYMCFQAPPSVEGREVLYVRNENNDEMIARNGGSSSLQNVTLSLKPDSRRAMKGRHYSITEIGIGNIMARLIDEAQEAMQLDSDRRECQVRFFDNAKIDGRVCRCIQVAFPVRRENLKFHIARIFIDAQTQLPVRFAAYTWPHKAGGKPRLTEEYTFLNLKPNIGLSDHDFDRQNSAYQFYQDRKSQDRESLATQSGHFPQTDQD